VGWELDGDVARPLGVAGNALPFDKGRATRGEERFDQGGKLQLLVLWQGNGALLQVDEVAEDNERGRVVLLLLPIPWHPNLSPSDEDFSLLQRYHAQLASDGMGDGKEEARDIEAESVVDKDERVVKGEANLGAVHDAVDDGTEDPRRALSAQ
jgi:hypothetical protein